ncbi:MAG: glycosyltransferase, partial [Candidatus Competibacteraceae bacterium]|nr:glycosyltransferase [Candidatus Competibacteraceae bacterium]
MERLDCNLKIGFITTSFPLWPELVSGPFVARLVRHLGELVDMTVLVPCADRPAQSTFRYQLRCFRYAPRRWQILAHRPGGIPASLNSRPWTVLLLPGFFLSLFLASWRLARRSDVIHANWSVVGAMVGLSARANDRPLITTLRGQDFNRAQRSALYRLCLNLCVRFSARITVVSEAIYRQMSTRYPK